MRTREVSRAGLIALLAAMAPAASGSDIEDIYLLRSVREAHAPSSQACPATRIGFEPFAEDAERRFSFWSVESRSDTGMVVDAARQSVATLTGCFGPTEDRARQNFHADIELGALKLRGRGECVALLVDFPEAGLYPVRCHLVLSGLPAPYVGGVLTTNTLTTRAAFGGDSDPPGYTQASIATIRLWRKR